jgi:HPt (histidine-containing phosphotransfer) domain-containing protein
VTAGDAVLARGLVETFEHSATEACGDIEDALDRGDFARARRAAHTLVGASANMGAVRLEAVAAAMEHAAAQADAVKLRPLVAAARRRCDAALAELKSLL